MRKETKRFIVRALELTFNPWFIGTIGSFLIVMKTNGLTCIDLEYKLIISALWVLGGFYCFDKWQTKYRTIKD